MKALKKYFVLSVFLIFVVNIFNSVTFFASSNEINLSQPRMLNGTPISVFNARYTASIRLKALEQEKGYGYGQVCTGSVISQRVILTAAVCRYNQTAYVTTTLDIDGFTVILGSMYLYQKDVYTLQYNVQSFISHPKFDFSPNSFLYDIALIFINGYIPWNYPTVAAIPLNTKAVAGSTECQVTGWGKPPADISTVKGLLLQLEVPIMNNTQCQYHLSIDSTAVFCAGNRNFSGVSDCDGDAGAPLTCNGLLTGLATWLNGCLPGPDPGVFTNLTFYNNWVIEINRTLNYTKYGNGSEGLFKSRIWIVISIFVGFNMGMFLKSKLFDAQ